MRCGYDVLWVWVRVPTLSFISLQTRYTSMSSTSNTPNDPRDSSRETRLTLPKSWKAESVGELLVNVVLVKAFVLGRAEDSGLRCVIDAMGSMGMFFAGMVMVTRNRYVDAFPQPVHPSMHRVSNNRSAVRLWPMDVTCRYAAWPVLILAINGVMNHHSLRAKEGGSTPWATLM